MKLNGGQILLLRNSWLEKLLVQGDQELNIGLLRDMPNFQSQYKCRDLARATYIRSCYLEANNQTASSQDD